MPVAAEFFAHPSGNLVCYEPGLFHPLGERVRNRDGRVLHKGDPGGTFAPGDGSDDPRDRAAGDPRRPRAARLVDETQHAFFGDAIDLRIDRNSTGSGR